jgi:hypothetical protein
MSRDPREEGTVAIELPADLEEWLGDRAASLGTGREDVIVQLLASYRAARSLDGDLDSDDLFAGDLESTLDVEAAVADVLEERGEELLADPVAAALERELADRLADEVEAAIEEHLPTVTDAVEGRIEDRSTGELEDRIDALETEVNENIVDVRERVIQVKREADTKAPADHDHEELERIEAIDRRLQGLAETLERLEAVVEDLDADLAAHRDEEADRTDRQDDIDERLADAEEKLTRVAWVVSDLTEQAGGRSAHEQAVARIKRAAAQEGVGTPDCERCGDAVDVSLLTDPECPHCGATVSDVRPTGGIFRTKATLTAAAELEAGED